MIAKRVLLAATLVVGVLTAWLLFAALPRWYGRTASTPAAAAVPTTAPTATTAPAGRKIKARLFYVTDDGQRLTSVERDVAYGEGTLEQAREIVNAQLAAVTEPLVSAIPQGTTLRALFIADHGQAYVDLSREAMSSHRGGSDAELLTVYTIVNAVTVNLPAVTAVQLLVDGKEMDTLAGHVDLRRPLAKNLAWIQ